MQKRRVSVLVLTLLSSASFSQASPFTFTKVKLDEDATLPCNQKCSGLVTWTMFSKPGDVLARCDQTSCWSQEGFQLSHDQYIKGNVSLTITSADFTKRTWYKCECEGREICLVSLRIEPINLSFNIKPGESLTLDLPISEPVELIFNRTANASTNAVRLCEVDGRQIQCDPEYKKRVSLNPNLQLKEVKHSDSGVYIIRDTKNDEVIGTYTVIITGEDPRDAVLPDAGPQPNQGGYAAIIAAVVCALFAAVMLIVVLVLFRKNRRLQRCLNNMRVMYNQTPDQQLQPQIHINDIPVRSPVMETESEQVNVQKFQDDPDNESEPFLHHTENSHIHHCQAMEEQEPNMMVRDDGPVDMEQTEREERVDSYENPQPATEPQLLTPQLVPDEPQLSLSVPDSSPTSPSRRLW